MMTMQDKIEEIKAFCVKKTPEIIADLQKKRFDNQGAFNDNEEWADNSPLVRKDKGFNEPLVDSGHLERELTTDTNWDLKPKASANKLTMTIPEEETFTESKYDVLQTGGKTDPYTSPRGNKMPGFNVPKRNFKDLSKKDADWIVNYLVRSIIQEFA